MMTKDWIESMARLYDMAGQPTRPVIREWGGEMTYIQIYQAIADNWLALAEDWDKEK